MTFLHPYALIGLAAVPLAVLIALWRARRQEITVPSIVLWERLRARIAESGHRRRRAIDLSLVLAAAFALLAVLAAVGPMLLHETGAGRHLVFVVDLSASMQARTADEMTRWRKLRDELDRAFGLLRAEDRVTLVPWPKESAEPLVRQTPHAARRAMRLLHPGPLPADIARALPIALGHIAPGEAARCIIFTDDPAALGGILPGNVSVVSVGESIDNAAIAAFDVDGGEVYTAITNNGGRRDVAVALKQDDGPARKRDVQLAANSRRDIVWKLLSPEPKKLTVTLEAPDALDADNRVVAVLRARRTLRVALIGPECEPLRRAFDAMADVAVTRFEDAAAGFDDFDLRVFYSISPEELPPGHVVLIAPERGVGPLRVGAETAAGALIARRDSPLVGSLDFSGVTVISARPGEATGLRPAVSSSAGKLIGSLTSDDSLLIYVGFDFASATTNWPLRWSFPAFWANVVGLIRDSAQAGWSCDRGTRYAANLLDERESTLAGETVAFSPEMLGEAPENVAPSLDIAPWLAVAALAAAIAHWRAKR